MCITLETERHTLLNNMLKGTGDVRIYCKYMQIQTHLYNFLIYVGFFLCQLKNKTKNKKQWCPVILIYEMKKLNKMKNTSL